MKTLVFKVIHQKPVNIDFSLETIRKHPVHTHFLIEATEKVLIYKFEPTKNNNLEEYKEFLLKYLKRKYKAYSVTVGELEKQIEITKN